MKEYKVLQVFYRHNINNWTKTSYQVLFSRKNFFKFSVKRRLSENIQNNHKPYVEIIENHAKTDKFFLIHFCLQNGF